MTVPDEKFMFDLIRAAFNQRRKTLVNALGNAAGLCLEKDSILCALEKWNAHPPFGGRRSHSKNLQCWHNCFTRACQSAADNDLLFSSLLNILKDSSAGISFAVLDFLNTTV